MAKHTFFWDSQPEKSASLILRQMEINLKAAFKIYLPKNMFSKMTYLFEGPKF